MTSTEGQMAALTKFLRPLKVGFYFLFCGLVIMHVEKLGPMHPVSTRGKISRVDMFCLPVGEFPRYPCLFFYIILADRDLTDV